MRCLIAPKWFHGDLMNKGNTSVSLSVVNTTCYFLETKDNIDCSYAYKSVNKNLPFASMTGNVICRE